MAISTVRRAPWVSPARCMCLIHDSAPPQPFFSTAESAHRLCARAGRGCPQADAAGRPRLSAPGRRQRLRPQRHQRPCRDRSPAARATEGHSARLVRRRPVGGRPGRPSRLCRGRGRGVASESGCRAGRDRPHADRGPRSAQRPARRMGAGPRRPDGPARRLRVGARRSGGPGAERNRRPRPRCGVRRPRRRRCGGRPQRPPSSAGLGCCGRQTVLPGASICPRHRSTGGVACRTCLRLQCRIRVPPACSVRRR